MLCNLYNQIAQGLYQGIGVDEGLTSTLWADPTQIGTSITNVGRFTRAIISSVETGNITARNNAFTTITFSSVIQSYTTDAVANIQQLETSSLSTFSAFGTTADFPQIRASSISTFSLVGASANFPQIITSSITGTNADFSGEMAASSISSFFSAVGGGAVAFPQLLISSVSTFSAIGTTNLQQLSEVVSIQLNATGNWPHNFNSGSIFFHSNITSNFTTQLFNVPTTQTREIVTTLVLAQGATPYYSSTLTINGSATTINWVDGYVPAPLGNRIECETFNILNISGTWSALGQYISFGTV